MVICIYSTIISKL